MKKSEQEQRFSDWLSEHNSAVIKIARSFTSSPEDFKDLYQEILLQLWKSVPVFRNQSSALTWLYRISLNRALAWKKKEAKHRSLTCIFSEDSLDFHRNDEKREQRTEELYEAIRKLKKPERSLVLLFLDGLSYKEIASIVDISESNVGVRLNRIKKVLLKHLTEASK